MILLGMKPKSAPEPPAMATEIIGTMKVEGTKQGVISGSGNGAGSAWTNLTSFTQSTPIVVTKQTDPASPKLFQAYNGHEQLKYVILQLTKKLADGRQVRDRIIKLTDVVISKVNKKAPDLEELSFTYRTIQIQNVAASTSTADDWNTSGN